MSSTALSEEKLAELVSCVLCVKTFTSPQILKCLHTFCKHSLEDHAKRKSIDDVQGLECPCCKQFTAQSDVTACTRTEQLITLSEGGTKRKLCSQCETEPAAYKCKHCAEFYCTTCKEMHLTDKQIKDHRFVALDDLTNAPTKSVTCTKHVGEEQKYFCFDCDVLLCSRCLLQGHDGHKRDTVQNAMGHVQAKVNEKLADVRRIINERFLRAEKLKDTRLMIQACADETSDVIKSRYETLKQQLEDDYQSLKTELKTSVDAEFQNVNAAIVAEEAKQSHAAAVTSYVEKTLATTAGALKVQDSIEDLITTMRQFCAEQDVKLLITSNLHGFNKTKSFQQDENCIGEINTDTADFHSRYQPLMKSERFENATVVKSIDMDFGRRIECNRISSGFGKIVLCFGWIDKIRIYEADGSKFVELDLAGVLTGPESAVLVNNADLVVAACAGLAIVDVTTSQVVKRLSKEPHLDVFLMNNRIYALNKWRRITIVKAKKPSWKIVSSFEVERELDYHRQLEERDFRELEGLPPFKEEMSSSATLVVSPSRIYCCIYDSEVLQCRLSGSLLLTISLDDIPAYLCAVGVDGRMLLSDKRNGQLVLQHKHEKKQVVKLKGVTEFQDLVFADKYTFWIMDVVNDMEGKCRLVKYNIA